MSSNIIEVTVREAGILSYLSRNSPPKKEWDQLVRGLGSESKKVADRLKEQQ